jgi:hypothetical protein
MSAGHGGQPEAEIGVRFFRVDCLADPLELRHPRNTEMAIRQQHPPSTGSRGFDPSGGLRALPQSQTDGLQLVIHACLFENESTKIKSMIAKIMKIKAARARPAFRTKSKRRLKLIRFRFRFRFASRTETGTETEIQKRETRTDKTKPKPNNRKRHTTLAA